MATSSSRRARKAIAAAVLMVFGLVCGGLCRLASGVEAHSFAAGSTPPAPAQITAGATYQLGIHGGVTALQSRHLPISAMGCEYSNNGAADQSLSFAPESEQTKATNVFGTFVAPVSGSISVSCLGLGPVFVDNADNSAGDLSGWLLMLTMLALLLGGALTLSGLRDGGPDDDAYWTLRDSDPESGQRQLPGPQDAERGL